MKHWLLFPGRSPFILVHLGAATNEKLLKVEVLFCFLMKIFVNMNQRIHICVEKHRLLIFTYKHECIYGKGVAV